MWHDNPFSFTYFNVRETDTTTLSWVPDAANDNADVSATVRDGLYVRWHLRRTAVRQSFTTNTVTQNAVSKATIGLACRSRPKLL